MAHGIGEVVSADGSTMKIAQNNNHQQVNQQALQQQSNSSQNARKNVGVMGSRRIFAAAFKLKVLDSYRNDIDCRGNQRATARKYGIHRRQIQKWLQCEENLRSSCAESNSTTTVTSSGCCTVPVGSSGVTDSPSSLSIAGQGEINSKPDVTTSSSLPSSSSSLNSSSNSPNCNSITAIGVAGTPIATPAPATPVPALNLSLARLHGDEQHQHQQQLTARQGPPPHLPSVPPGASLRHSGLRISSPTSFQYLHHNHDPHNRVPSSSTTNSVPLRNVLVGYTEYVSQQEALQQQQQQQQNQHRHHRRQQPIEKQRDDDEQQHRHEKTIKDSSSPERKFSYVMNRSTVNYDQHDVLSRTGSSYSPESEAYYHPLESYHNSAGCVALRCNNNNNRNDIALGSGASLAYLDKNNVESAGNASEPSPLHTQSTSFASCSSPLLLLHATTIKSERASPDSLATPGPCETPGSPESAASVPTSRHHRNQHQLDQQHQQQSLPRRIHDLSSDTCNIDSIDVCNMKNNLVNRASVAATTAAAAIATASPVAAVHSNETTTPSAHVHMNVDSHASTTRDSEKQQREREQPHQQLHRDSVKMEYEDRMGSRVKEEIVEREEGESLTTSTSNPTNPMTTMMMMREPKREMMSKEEALIVRSRYHRERTSADVVASCPDYQEATAVPVETATGLSSGGCSGLVSLIARESTGRCSVLSSPRAASSSGISTSSSCSDSEIDPLDYSSISTQNAISDLSRRRSFSLRFKLDVLDAFHGDTGVAGNQRATARKFGINRRQVQKWLGQESELRGEIALRGGDLRQRLGPIIENTNTETSTAVDLRTCPTHRLVIGPKSEIELEHLSSPLYFCDGRSSAHRLGFYHPESLAESPEIQLRGCTLKCCIDRRSSIGYPESQSSLYCYSPRDPLDIGCGSEGIDVTVPSSPLKRSGCSLSCCNDMLPSPKRLIVEYHEDTRSSPSSQNLPPQDAPLCLVKPKSCFENVPLQTEPVTSTVPTPPALPVAPPPPPPPQPAPATPGSKKNAILFKPYLDNPVSKPTEEIQLSHHSINRGLSPLSAQSVKIHNNNNCHGTRNLNDETSSFSDTQYDYALELSLRVPVTWRTHNGLYGDFPDRFRSAFVRYPTSPHYT